MSGRRGGHSRDRFRFLYLLLAMVTFLLLTSFVRERFLWEEIGFAAIVLTAVRAMWGQRRTLIWIVALGAATLLGRGSGLLFPSTVELVLATAMTFLFLGTVTLLILQQVLDENHFSDDSLYGALCAYLLIGITFALLYELSWRLDPAAFRVALGPVEADRGTLIYFSFVTLTTLGYGDIIPVTPLGRTIAWMEAALGQFFLAILVAHLVGLRFALRRRPPEAGGEG